MACVAVPLIKAGESVGVLMFFVGKSWAADEEIVALLARIAENVSFALDNFERASEKARADAAEGAADAHVRGAQRDQRSDHAGQVARPNCSNWCAKPRPRADGSTRPASCWRGPTATIPIWWPWPGRPPTTCAGSRFRSTRLIRKDAGCAATRSAPGRPASPTICAPTRAASAFHKFISQRRRKSGAAFPLFVSGQPVGVMFFISAETGHVHAGIRRTAAAARRQRVVRAGEFRSRRREGEDRRAEGAPDAHVRGAERDQRSDHAGEIAQRTVRTGVRGRRAGRQVHLDHRSR